MNAVTQTSYLQNLSSRAREHSTFLWSDGQFDVARRDYTELVEGSILSTKHLVMVTLEGGAARHTYATDCGYRYDGIDAPGSISFLPARCERRLRLEAVSWRWASIAISPDRFGDMIEGVPINAFSTRDDRFLSALLGQLAWYQEQDGHLDLPYLDAMLSALSHHIRVRYQTESRAVTERLRRLPSWAIRRITDYIVAQLPGEVRVSMLANLTGLSEGHFHRAFRATTGKTPLQFINELRIQRAIQILNRHPINTAELARRSASQVQLTSLGYSVSPSAARHRNTQSRSNVFRNLPANRLKISALAIQIRIVSDLLQQRV